MRVFVGKERCGPNNPEAHKGIRHLEEMVSAHVQSDRSLVQILAGAQVQLMGNRTYPLGEDLELHELVCKCGGKPQHHDVRRLM
jgi:hypothetical protein